MLAQRGVQRISALRRLVARFSSSEHLPAAQRSPRLGDDEGYTWSPFPTEQDDFKTLPAFQTKTPMELIAEVPPIPIDADFVVCDGMYFEPHLPRSLGHPPESIMLNTRIPHSVVTCPYCGLRFYKRRGHH